MNKLTGLLLLLLLPLFACQDQQPTIVGLWEITGVRAGEQTMTPNARWARFNADGTQQSGNGWLQHSLGTYELDKIKSTLTLTSSNAPADEFGDFGYRIEGDKMFWTRTEEGTEIEVTEEGTEIEVELRRAEVLPAGYADEVRGLWQLTDSEGDSPYLATEGLSHLFVRWDGKYFLYRNDGRVGGVYNVHGHQAELELIPYAENLDRSWWRFSKEGESLKLELLNTDETVSRTFVRALAFPE